MTSDTSSASEIYKNLGGCTMVSTQKFVIYIYMGYMN